MQNQPATDDATATETTIASPQVLPGNTTDATGTTTLPDPPQHPGIYLQALLKEQQMNGKMLALRTGTSSAHISNVLNAKKPISLELARSIEFVLGIDYLEFITRQSHYEKWCLVENEKQQITAEEMAIAANLEKLNENEEVAFINTGKEYLTGQNLNHQEQEQDQKQERVIALRKLFQIDNLLRAPAVLQALIDPPPQILTQKPYQALALLNNLDALVADYKKREDFIAAPLNQNRLIETLPTISALKAEGKNISLALKALEQCGIIISHLAGSQHNLFYAYIKKVEPGTLLVILTEQYRSHPGAELWVFLEDLLHKVNRGEVSNRLVYYQPPASQPQAAAQPYSRRPRHSSAAAQPKDKHSGNHQPGSKVSKNAGVYARDDESYRKRLNIRTHPGIKLLNWLRHIEMTQRELALRCGVSEVHISTICSGKKKITSNMANKLEYVLGIPADYLLTLQANNRTSLYVSADAEKSSALEERLAGNLHLYEEILSTDEAWAHLHKGRCCPVFVLRKALKVNNLTNIPALARGTDPRLGKINDRSLLQLFAWYMISDQMHQSAADREAPAPPFNKEKLEAKLPAISALSAGRQLEEAMPGLVETLSECGITLKAFPGDPKLSAKGYIKKNANGSLLICIKADHEDPRLHRLELFHLLGHIINGDLNHTALLIDHDRINDAADKKADRFAAQHV